MSLDLEERIKAIQNEIARTQKNKATEHHLGLLKAKIAKLKKAAQSHKSSSFQGVKKEGDATVAMIGFPSVGKSSILNCLTNAKSKIAAYEFTTTECIPGIMDYKGALIQVLDLPGIIEGASEGRGMGKAVLSHARMSDLLLIVTDVQRLASIGTIISELEESTFRLNKTEPRIDIKIFDKDGISINSSLETLDEQTIKTIKEVIREFGIHNARIVFNEPFDLDRLIDKLARNRKYVNCIVVINKAEDLKSKNEEKIEVNGTWFDLVYVSALTGKNIELLKTKIWEQLGLIRVFTVKRNGELDDKPLILKKGSTVKDLCLRLHKDLLKFFRYAKITGRSAKFHGQKLGLEHVLQDGDTVTIYTR